MKGNVLSIVILAGLMLFECSVAVEARSFNVGYVQHPAAYKNMAIITKVYAEVGIEVHFVEMPVKRRILALSSGELDADMGAPTYISALYPNIVKLNPAVAMGVLYLFCPDDYTNCNDEQLYQSKEPIFMDGIDAITVRRFFSNPIAASISTLENDDAIAGMFNSNRVNLFVDNVIDDKVFFELTRKHKRYQLGKVPYHHHINAKHAELKERIEAAFQKVFAELGTQR